MSVQRTTEEMNETTSFAYGSNNYSTTEITRIVETTSSPEDLTIMSIIMNTEANISSITGYANVPLLPLSKACAPLVGIIHDILSLVQTAINETPEVPPDGLTIDESAAIRLYTMQWPNPHSSLYKMLNCAFKMGNRNELQPYFKYLKLFLTALVKLQFVPPQTVWRGVTSDLSGAFPTDKVVTWWRFSSCTTRMPVLENDNFLGNTGPRTLFSIETINGRSIRAHSHFATEDEILLLPGTRMIVQSQLNPAPDLHIIHLKQIIPKETLLELPFKGISNIFNHGFIFCFKI